MPAMETADIANAKPALRCSVRFCMRSCEAPPRQSDAFKRSKIPVQQGFLVGFMESLDCR